MLDSRDTCRQKLYPERKSCGFKNIPIRVDEALFKSQSNSLFGKKGFVFDLVLKVIHALQASFKGQHS